MLINSEQITSIKQAEPDSRILSEFFSRVAPNLLMNCRNSHSPLDLLVILTIQVIRSDHDRIVVLRVNIVYVSN